MTKRYFRAGERRVIARLMSQAPSGSDPPPARRLAESPIKVIATGGGAFACHAETRELILRRGIAVWLDAELDTLVERTGRRTNRPLLQNGNPREILGALKTQRAGLYAQAPVHVTSGVGPQRHGITQVMAGILNLARRRAGRPTMTIISVDIADRPYDVRIAPGLLGDLAAQCGARRAQGACADRDRSPRPTPPGVAVVAASLIAAGHEPAWRILPPGEASKSWADTGRDH